ncbi:hypothetical protein [Streptomyces erythrochromogenes]|uniref:hypothetical protein n=1 Tax=Streptomyces erythrochromogenes TaxID=285574 RepID=UPI003694C083
MGHWTAKGLLAVFFPEGGMAVTLLTVAIILAALVIRTAVAELRAPGSARRQWAFLTDRRAWAAGVGTALALGALGWATAGPTAAIWAALAGLLAASLTRAGTGSGTGAKND